MKIKREKDKKLYSRLSFWLGILVVGLALGVAIQFSRAWVEPPAGVTPPGGDVAAPVNTGNVSQTKTGPLADICLDRNSDGVNDVCLSSAGTGGGTGGRCVCRIAAWGNMEPVSLYVYRNCGSGWGAVLGYQTAFNRAGWGGAWSASDIYFPCDTNYSSFLTGDLFDGWHSSSDCTAAGGTVVSDGSIKFCRFNTSNSSCPSGWNPYLNWTTTSVKTCNGTTEHNCSGVTSCTTGSHDWGNIAPESCSYKNATWNSSTYNGYYCIGTDWNTGVTYNGCYPTDHTAGCGYYGEGDYGCAVSCSQSVNWWGCKDVNNPACFLCPYDNSYCSTQLAICSPITQIGCY